MFLRDSNEIDKIKASSYISDKANKINTLRYTVISGTHNIGMSMTVSEVEDLIRVTLYGPLDRYFGVGFGSNSMTNTYAIIVNGHKTYSDDDDYSESSLFFEQLLDEHKAGYSLSPSFIVDDHTIHSSENNHHITLSRPLSSAVEIDQYWIFSCIDDHIDIIWSVGSSTNFIRHVSYGQDRLKYVQTQDSSYDKTAIIVNSNDFKLKINWGSIFVMLLLSVIAWYIVKKYKQQIIDFANQIRSNISNRLNDPSNALNIDGNTCNQYGSAQDAEPLINDKEYVD